jgi:hypothetical protein
VTDKQLALRILATGIVLALGVLPLACGVTADQRMADAHQDLHSADMEAAINEARK